MKSEVSTRFLIKYWPVKPFSTLRCLKSTISASMVVAKDCNVATAA